MKINTDSFLLYLVFPAGIFAICMFCYSVYESYYNRIYSEYIINGTQSIFCKDEVRAFGTISLQNCKDGKTYKNMTNIIKTGNYETNN